MLKQIWGELVVIILVILGLYFSLFGVDHFVNREPQTISMGSYRKDFVQMRKEQSK